MITKSQNQSSLIRYLSRSYKPLTRNLDQSPPNITRALKSRWGPSSLTRWAWRINLSQTCFDSSWARRRKRCQVRSPGISLIRLRPPIVWTGILISTYETQGISLRSSLLRLEACIHKRWTILLREIPMEIKEDPLDLSTLPKTRKRVPSRIESRNFLA